MNRTWDKVVLVKGWKSSSAWGFPKGKINQNEDDRDCAVREVYLCLLMFVDIVSSKRLCSGLGRDWV